MWLISFPCQAAPDPQRHVKLSRQRDMSRIPFNEPVTRADKVTDDLGPATFEQSAKGIAT
jgi:hypothetical protein